MTELANIFNVSKETIRRDLIHLNEIGAIQKKYGGAVSAYEFQSQPVSMKLEKNHDLKERICRKALEFIPQNSIIYIDTGSTCTCLASMLKQYEGLTVITNSLSAAEALVDSKCMVHVAGGQLNSLNLSFEGYQTTSFLGTIKVELAFMGSTGFDQHNGQLRFPSLIHRRNRRFCIILRQKSCWQTVLRRKLRHLHSMLRGRRWITLFRIRICRRKR